MNPIPEITPISPADASEVKQLFRSVWTETYPNKEAGISVREVDAFFTMQMSAENVQKFKEKLETLPANHHYFVARIGKFIVGLTEVLVEKTENKLNIICVLPEYQGKGIGYALWQKAFKVMNHKNPTTLFVVSYSTHAIEFYKRLGFVQDGGVPAGEEFVLAPGTIVPEIRMVLKS